MCDHVWVTGGRRDPVDASDRPLCSAGTVNRANQVGRKLLVAWCIRGCSGAVWSGGVFFLFFVFVLFTATYFSSSPSKPFKMRRRHQTAPRPSIGHASQRLLLICICKKMRGCEIEWKNKYIGAERFPHSAVACSGFYFWKVIYRVPENTANIWNLFPDNQSSRDVWKWFVD